MSTQSFIQQYLPDAQVAAQQLGFPVSVVLAQWINETGSGSSSAFRNQNNYAGVSLGGQVLSYPDKTAGLGAYIRRWADPVYGPTRSAMAQNGGQAGNPYNAAKIVEASPWAGGHYNGNGLELLIAQNNLQQYDTGKTNYPVPPTLAAAEASGGGSGQGTSTAALASSTGTGGSDDSSDCLWKLGKVGIGPVNLGGQCLLTRSQGRALLGAASLVAGVTLMLVGTGFLAFRKVPRVPVVG